MTVRRRPHPGALPRELEWVDAESPDWPGPGEPHGEPAGTTPPQAPEDLERLRATARRRLARLRRRSAGTIDLDPPWRERRLHETPFCVIDFETTGGGRNQDDEILEIGAVHVQTGELGREFSTLVDPRRPITAAARGVHGISPSALMGAPVLEHALPWLLEMTRDRVLVFHNASFDLPFLQRALQESQREALQQPVLDTVVLARHAFGSPCNLGTLGRRLGLPVEILHRALEDARLTARLLLVLLQLAADIGWDFLAQLPGLTSASPVMRGRRHARLDPLVERLEAAIHRGETLRLTYHAAGGGAPMELTLRPRRLWGGVGLIAEESDSGRTLRLDLWRIGPLRRFT